MARPLKKPAPPAPPEVLEAAIGTGLDILSREDSPDGLARIERTIGAAWPSLTSQDRSFVCGYALGAHRERKRLLEAVPASPAEGARPQ